MCDRCIEVINVNNKNYIDITDCPEPLNLLKFDNVEKLKVSYNRNFTNIPDNFIDLKYLSVVGCPNISNIPDTLTNITDLDIAESNVSNIPDTLTKLKTLRCEKCVLEYIPNTLTTIEKIYCNDCSKLKVIPYTLSALKYLDCKNCVSLEEIPFQFMNTKSSKKLKSRLVKFLTNLEFFVPPDIVKYIIRKYY